MQVISIPKGPRLSTLQRARLHVGRATGPATEDFIRRSPFRPSAFPKLRISPSGPDAHWVHVGQRGIGSPDLWAKDMPRINTINAKIALPPGERESFSSPRTVTQGDISLHFCRDLADTSVAGVETEIEIVSCCNIHRRWLNDC